MKLILSLLKRTMIELRDIYTKLELDGLLDEKEDSTSMGLIDTESSEREAADNELNDRIEANKVNDEAMANVVKWGVYASAMQKMVDEEMAELIRQEFEKAREEYLKDPTATKNWDVTKGEDGNWVSDNPYYLESPKHPVIDFLVTSAKGYTNTRGSFYHFTIDVPIFLPNLTIASNMLYSADLFNRPVVLPRVNDASAIFINANAFNQPLSLPNAPYCNYLLYGATAFNQSLNLPKATNCNYLLYGARSFNQPLSLPKAKNCLYLLYRATVFNQALGLPMATSCAYLLFEATSFNSTLDLPEATSCEHMLYGATAFNQPLTLPKAITCRGLLSGATAFNQAVSLPSASDCLSAFDSTAMSADSISATLDSLPEWTDGGTHIITFAGCPGAAELTQESPSVAAAVAKGWTVGL